MFSADLQEEDISLLYGNVTAPIWFIGSGEDEYVPEKDAWFNMAQKHKKASDSLKEIFVIRNADHALSHFDWQNEFCLYVKNIISSLTYNK